MTLPDEPAPAKAECIFGTQRLLPLLEAIAKEIEGVKLAQDTEHIHRMRVASRRFRAALPLFVSCIPEKKYRQWMQEIQKITRALGDARDTDVQIAFIIKLLEKRPSGFQIKEPADSQPVPDNDAETILLTHLQKKRSKLQTTVVSALEKLEKSNTIEEMRTFFQNHMKRAKKIRKKSLTSGIPSIAAGRISHRLDVFLSYERWVNVPDAVVEHHAMRIAAKKLRYTMEVYAPLYRLGLKKYLSRVKKVQEILGDLHDCDVWIDTVMVMILKERSTFHTKDSSKNEQVKILGGFKHFLANREKERKRLYRRYVRYWDSLVRAHIVSDLRKTLKEGRKRKFRPGITPTEDTIRSSVSSLANQFPEGLTHSHAVTSLALMLFDDLADLHRMDPHERFLLECAGYLHDIGWKFGQKGHAKHSAEMIVSDENLLLDIIDRGIIALVCRAHRGKVHPESNGMFSLLSSQERNSVMMLASLLRIADGLDYSHNGAIGSVHCTMYADEVLLEISAIRGVSAEIKRAQQKGDLFTRVFKRKLVIQ